MSTITLENVGPVARLDIPVQPGATILRGTSDLGKSETLKAISRLAGGRDDVSCRTGAKSGYVEGFGVRLGVGKATRRTGTLEALAIEDNFGLGTLIDGDNLQSPEAADRARIKALLKISGIKADAAAFYAIMPGGKEEFDKIISPKSLASDDPVDMARKIKSDLEAAARQAEADAEKEDGMALADRNAGDGLDLKAETDAAKLQAAHTAAVAAEAAMTTKRDAAQKAKTDAEEARKKLDAATGSESQAMAVAEAALTAAKERKAATKDAAEAAGREVDRITAELHAAKLTLTAAEDARDMAGAAVVTARQGVEAVKRNAAAYAGWQAAIDAAASVEEPDVVAVALATRKVATTRTALDSAAVIRAARERIAKAAAHTNAAEGHRAKAHSLRDAARETDTVLSEAVNSKYLKVRAGRLVTEVNGRGEVPFHERSDGTRTRIACMEKLERIRAVNPDQLALVPIPQRNWADLAPAAKVELVQWAVEHNACLITAEVCDDPVLTAEVRQ